MMDTDDLWTVMNSTRVPEDIWKNTVVSSLEVGSPLGEDLSTIQSKFGDEDDENGLIANE